MTTKKIYEIDWYMNKITELNSANPREEYEVVLQKLPEMRSVLEDVATWDCLNVSRLVEMAETFDTLRDEVISELKHLVHLELTDDDYDFYTLLPREIQNDLESSDCLSFDQCIGGGNSNNIWDFIPCADIDEFGCVRRFVYGGDVEGNYMYSECGYWRVGNVYEEGL